MLYRPRHKYTRLLISSISKDGPGKFLDSGACPWSATLHAARADQGEQDALRALLQP